MEDDQIIPSDCVAVTFPSRGRTNKKRRSRAKEAMVKKQIHTARETGKPMTPTEALHFIGKMKERQDQKEYQKIIEENNNHS